MKYLYLLLTFIISSFSIEAQDCVSLGCASSYTITTDGTQADQPSGPEWGCYNGYPRKQTIWQFFYSPSGGNYTQSFSSAADLDWLVYDLGITPPTLTCPVSPLGWTQVGCDLSYDPGGPTGPGEESTVSTTAGHYYAVALILWEPLTLTFTFGTPQLGGTNLTSANCLTLLPVNLISFTAAQQGNNVFTKWKVSEEINVSHYEIETGTDGRNFSTIGKVSAANNKEYSFLHKGISNNGALYYRLKTVDLDGKITYSGIVKILVTANNSLRIAENPVMNTLNITGLKSNGQIRIMDLNGRTIIEKTVQTQTVSVDIAAAHRGLYLLQYFDGNNTQTLKFVKQ